MNRSRQQGFSLLEVLVATGLTIGVIVATVSAVASSMHGVALADNHMALNDDALGALADVRVASAYDSPNVFGALVGRSASTTIHSSGLPDETIVVKIAPNVGSPLSSAIAIATVTQGPVTVVQRQTIFAEAPAPGSTVIQRVSTPSAKRDRL